MNQSYSFNCRVTDLNQRIQNWLYSEELQNIVQVFGGEYPRSMSVSERAKWLENFSDRWDYRKYQAQAKDAKTGENARWKISSADLTESQISAVEKGIASLGLTGMDMPSEKSFDYIIALGGARFSCLYRPKYVYELLTRHNISARATILLSGMRPIAESERSATDSYAPDAITEYDLINAGAEKAFERSPNFKEERYHHENPNRSWAIRTYDTSDGQIPLFSLSGPSSQPDVRRANSADTYQFFLDKFHVEAGQRLLLVTSQIYVPYQQLEAQRTLAYPHRIYIETVGFPAEWSGRLQGMMEPANYLQEIRSTIQAINRFLDMSGIRE